MINTIKSIRLAYGDGKLLAFVGFDGVTTIEEYNETGSMSYIPHVRALKGNYFYIEVPKSACVVEYFAEAQADD